MGNLNGDQSCLADMNHSLKKPVSIITEYLVSCLGPLSNREMFYPFQKDY